MGFRRFGRSRVDSAREAELARDLQAQTDGSPLAGRPLVLQPRPFELGTNDYLKAAAGPPAWSVRLARIQRLQDELEEQVRAAWRAHWQDERRATSDREASWAAYLDGLDLSSINALIEKHNAYYPVEAGLRMEWPSGRYIVPAGIGYPLPKLTPEALLAAFPPPPSQGPVSAVSPLPPGRGLG